MKLSQDLKNFLMIGRRKILSGQIVAESYKKQTNPYPMNPRKKKHPGLFLIMILMH